MIFCYDDFLTGVATGFGWGVFLTASFAYFVYLSLRP